MIEMRACDGRSAQTCSAARVVSPESVRRAGGTGFAALHHPVRVPGGVPADAGRVGLHPGSVRGHHAVRRRAGRGRGARRASVAGRRCIVAGVLGNVAGSYIAWAVGKYAGQAAVSRWGRRVGIREHDIDRATAWFERHGASAVLFGRVVPVVRTFISLPAGFAGMPADPVRPVHHARLHSLDGRPGHRGVRARRELAKRCQRLPRPHLRDRGHHRGRRGGRDCPAPAPEAP